jgi:transcriptional regulator with GAF, ATPase, and Fis domain
MGLKRSSSRAVAVDVRVIAATNRDLSAAIRVIALRVTHLRVN